MEINHFIEHCGISFKQEGDLMIAYSEIREELKNPYGFVHGGFLFTLADTTAGMMLRQLGKPSVTLNSEFHYYSNCNEGTLRGIPELIKTGKTISVVRVRIIDEADELLAEGTFTYFARTF